MINVKATLPQTPSERGDVPDVEPLKLLVRWANDEVLAAANMTINPSDFFARELNVASNPKN